MDLLGVKNRRKLFDAAIIGVSSTSAYLIGFFQSLEMGAMTFALILPCLFLMVLGFAHVVLRSGRKFDETVHDLKHQALEAIVFIMTMISGYYTSVSGIKSLPTLPSTALAFFLLISLYLMAYRPNR